MSDIDDGGPAFPVHEDMTAAEQMKFKGATLRDYFAAKSIDMATLAEKHSPTGNRGEPTYRGIAKRAYLLADAMLEARKK